MLYILSGAILMDTELKGSGLSSKTGNKRNSSPLTALSLGMYTEEQRSSDCFDIGYINGGAAVLGPGQCIGGQWPLHYSQQESDK